ncbi:unnamed protein product, partial [Trypanosoma congolense IL3000]
MILLRSVMVSIAPLLDLSSFFSLLRFPKCIEIGWEMRRHSPLFTLASPPSVARLRLLTYPMALAQPDASVPLVRSGSHSALCGGGSHFQCGSDTASHLSTRVKPRGHAGVSAGSGEHSQSSAVVNPHRWLRNPDELCVASLHRSKDINEVNSYVATYKFDDPQWAPLLLPGVICRPRMGTCSSGQPRTGGKVDSAGEVGEATSASGSEPPPPTESSSSLLHGDYRVWIDHNKLINVEC